MAHMETLDTKAVFWQGADDGIPEPALLLRSYNNGTLLEIQQEDRAVLINVESLDAFLKAIKHVVKAGQLEAVSKAKAK